MDMLCDVHQCSTSPFLYLNFSVTFGVYAYRVKGYVSLAVHGTKTVNSAIEYFLGFDSKALDHLAFYLKINSVIRN